MQNEMRMRRHDGTYRWYLVQGVPVRDESGAIARWVTDTKFGPGMITPAA